MSPLFVKFFVENFFFVFTVAKLVLLPLYLAIIIFLKFCTTGHATYENWLNK